MSVWNGVYFFALIIKSQRHIQCIPVVKQHEIIVRLTISIIHILRIHYWTHFPHKIVSSHGNSYLWGPVLETAVSEINRRFSSESQSVLKGICALAPGNPHFLNFEMIRPLAEQYKANVEDLQLELRQLKRMMDCKTEDGTVPHFPRKLPCWISVHSSRNTRMHFFETENLVRIACTIPATSAQAEKSFSCLKLIKTHIRTTMLSSRLSSLAMISMHPRRAKNLDLDKVVDIFVRLYPNCRIVLV